MRFLALFAALTVLPSSCVQEAPFSRNCPCAEGYECCQPENFCRIRGQCPLRNVTGSDAAADQIADSRMREEAASAPSSTWDAAQEAIPEAMPEAIPEAMPEAVPEAVPEGEDAASSDSVEAGSEKGEAGVGTLTLLAGGLGGVGNGDGIGIAARFANPFGLASDGAGNLYVADDQSRTIRKIVVRTGAVTTLAGDPGVIGSADGVGASARFENPLGLAYDGAGYLYTTETVSHTIRKISIATGEVTTLAGAVGEKGSNDGIGVDARFWAPFGVVADGAGNLFVAEYANRTIRKIVIATGQVTTLAGSPGEATSLDGVGALARFKCPRGLSYDHAGSLFVSDNCDNLVRKVTISTGEVTTVAATLPRAPSDGGTSEPPRIGELSDVAADGNGNLFLVDSGNYIVWKLELATQTLTSFAGFPNSRGMDDGIAQTARFFAPKFLAVDPAGSLFLSDDVVVRQIELATGAVTTLAGDSNKAGNIDGMGSTARFNAPEAVTTDGLGVLYVADTGNGILRKVALSTGQVITPAVRPEPIGCPRYVPPAAWFCKPTGLAYEGRGDLFVADSYTLNFRRFAIATGEISSLLRPAEGGSGSDAGMPLPSTGMDKAVATDGAGNLFVAQETAAIRKVVLSTGVSTILAGRADRSGSEDGPGTGARFGYIRSLVADDRGNLYVAEPEDVRMVVVATGMVTTLAGTQGAKGYLDGIGPGAQFRSLSSIAYDGLGNLYVSDTDNHAIRKIHIASKTVTTAIGGPSRTGVLLGPLPARLNTPTGLAFTPTGELVITDENSVLLARF